MEIFLPFRIVQSNLPLIYLHALIVEMEAETMLDSNDAARNAASEARQLSKGR